MKQQGVEPNAFNYSALISAVGKCGQWEKSFELYDEMKELGLKPVEQTYVALLTLCGNEGMYGKVEELLDEMTDVGVEISDTVYHTFVKASFEAKDYSTAMEQLKRVWKARLTPCFQNGAPTWDFHDMDLASSCMLVSHVLLTHLHRHSLHVPPALVFITGIGYGSDPTKGPVLRTQVPKFLADNFGPETSRDERNEGVFIIHKDAARTWLLSEDFIRFEQIMGADNKAGIV
eukprot:scaffold15192_cov256-Amphora_coffeaeformis.AAC.1